jgi:hypothetical protein
MPGLCNRAVLRNVVLSFARFLEGVRIDALESEENPVDPGAPAFLDEPLDLVGYGIDLNREADGQPFAFAQCDQTVDNWLPVPIACKVVVGDEEALDALRQVAPDDALDVVGASISAKCARAR